MGCWLVELGLVSWRALHPTRRAPVARGDLPSDKGRLERNQVLASQVLVDLGCFTPLPSFLGEVVFGADGGDV
jgi:hypothetical protein